MALGTPTGQTRVLNSGCRSDLISLDGAPLAVKVTGEVDGVLDVIPCIDTILDLTAGQHRLIAADGKLTGLDLDRLVLDSPQRAPASPP